MTNLKQMTRLRHIFQMVAHNMRQNMNDYDKSDGLPLFTITKEYRVSGEHHDK